MIEGVNKPQSQVRQALLTVAAGQHGVISLDQVVDRGISARTIGRRLAAGEWVCEFPGAFRIGIFPPTLESRAMAACLAAGAGAVVSHRTVAALLGAPGVPRWIEVTVPSAPHRALDSVQLHVATLSERDVCQVHGIPSTTAARLVIDLAGVSPGSGSTIWSTTC
jgi:hypothetical protein